MKNKVIETAIIINDKYSKIIGQILDKIDDKNEKDTAAWLVVLTNLENLRKQNIDNISKINLHLAEDANIIKVNNN